MSICVSADGVRPVCDELPDRYGVTPVRLDASDPERRMAACEVVIDLCAAAFGVDGGALRGPNRSEQSVARVRQIAMYLCHTLLAISLTETGRGFARDRTTVAHAVQTIEMMRDDADFDQVIERMEALVGSFIVSDRDHDRRYRHGR